VRGEGPPRQSMMSPGVDKNPGVRGDGKGGRSKRGGYSSPPGPLAEPGQGSETIRSPSVPQFTCKAATVAHAPAPQHPPRSTHRSPLLAGRCWKQRAPACRCRPGNTSWPTACEVSEHRHQLRHRRRVTPGGLSGGEAEYRHEREHFPGSGCWVAIGRCERRPGGSWHGARSRRGADNALSASSPLFLIPPLHGDGRNGSACPAGPQAAGTSRAFLFSSPQNKKKQGNFAARFPPAAGPGCGCSRAEHRPRTMPNPPAALASAALEQGISHFPA